MSNDYKKKSPEELQREKEQKQIREWNRRIIELYVNIVVSAMTTIGILILVRALAR